MQIKSESQTPPHFGSPFANQVLDWLPSDTQENYKKLIQDPVHQTYFAEMGWDKPGAITYKFNSEGYRADEFDGGPYLMALGCSYTAGIGLPVEDTWPHKTAVALGLKCANLAWGGYSADTCYRLAEYWIDKLQPKYVCMLVPPRSRIELLLDKELANNSIPVEVYLPQSESKYFNSNDLFLKHWFLNDDNATINQRKNVRAIKQLCNEFNIPCTILYAEQHMAQSREEVGYARDYMHAGPKAHTIVAEEYINGYET